MRIEFHGLCLVATGKGKLDPAENDYVTVLLPENSPRLKHKDGKDAVRHTPHMLIPKRNVKNPGSLDVIKSTGQQKEFVMIPLSKVDVSFEPEPSHPGTMPNQDVTVGLSKLVDLAWFTDDITLDPHVQPLHAMPAITGNSAGAQLVATRVRLKGGRFYTVDAKPRYEWSYDYTLAKTQKSPPTSGVAVELWFTAKMPNSFKLVLAPFDGSAAVELEITDETGDLEIQIGNECLHPKDWDNNHARCHDNPPSKSVADTDFKAHYELLESSDGNPIKVRIGTRELPVPTITDHAFVPQRVPAIALGADTAVPGLPTSGDAEAPATANVNAIVMAGSEWCQRALIQV